MNIVPGKLYIIASDKFIEDVWEKYAKNSSMSIKKIIGIDSKESFQILCIKSKKCDKCNEPDVKDLTKCECCYEFLFKNKTFILKDKFIEIKYGKKFFFNAKNGKAQGMDFTKTYNVQHLHSSLQQIS